MDTKSSLGPYTLLPADSTELVMKFAHAKKEQVYFGDFPETICILKLALRPAYYVHNLGK